MFRKIIAFLLSGLLLLSACAPETAIEPTLTPTPPPTATNTPTATETSAPIPTPIPTESGLLTWEEIKDMSDEDIFARIEIPNPADYRLSQELQGYKVLRNEDGTSYALFQDLNDNVLLAQNLETGKIEHAAYAEYEENGLQGVPILILNDESLGSAWIGLDSNDPQAQDRLALGFKTALSLSYWSKLHPTESSPIRASAGGSLEEIPAIGRAIRIVKLTNQQRLQATDHMRAEMLKELAAARNSGESLTIKLRDRGRTEVDLTSDLLVFRMVKDNSVNWYYDVMNVWGMPGYGGLRTVLAERDNSIVTTTISLPSFSPSAHELHPVGWLMPGFLRMFFGGYYWTPTNSAYGISIDLTGPVVEHMCMPGAIPKDILDYFNGKGILLFNINVGGGPSFRAESTENCAVQYQH